MLTGLTR